MTVAYPRRYPRRRAESLFPDLYQLFEEAVSLPQCQLIACQQIGLSNSVSTVSRQMRADFASHLDILKIYGADTLLQSLVSDQPLTRPVLINRQKCLMGWRLEQKLYHALQNPFQNKSGQLDHASLITSAVGHKILHRYQESLASNKPHIAYACLHQVLTSKDIMAAKDQTYLLIDLAYIFAPTLCRYLAHLTY